MCASLVCNVFATANGFVPSISFKEEPDIVPIEPPSDGGRPILGPVYDEETKEEISQILDGCLVITPISEVHTSTEIPPEAAEELLRVYHELTAGTMEIPYSKVQGYTGETMVIRDLFDASWLCGTENSDHDHPTEIEPEGIVFDLTLHLGLRPGTDVIVMVYTDGEWTPAVNVRDNGDGTFTCTFEKLGIIAISVPVDTQSPETPGGEDVPVTGDDADVWLWVCVMVGALAAFAAVLLIYRRSGSDKKKK